MGKTLILSQRQLDEILESDFSYLNDTDFREYPRNEVSPQTKLSDGDGEPVTTDRVSDQLTHKNSAGPWDNRSHSHGALQSEGKKKLKLSESNSELEGSIWKIDPTTMKGLVQIYSSSKAPEDAPGRIRLKGLIDKGYVTYTQCTSIKSDLEKELRNGGGKETSAFLEMGGNTLLRFVNKKLDLYTGMITYRKETDKKNGKENVYQASGGTKNATGTAHSTKNGNIIIKQQ